MIQTRYFPVVVTGYGGVAMMRGSKVHNDARRPDVRHADLEGHLDRLASSDLRMDQVVLVGSLIVI